MKIILFLFIFTLNFFTTYSQNENTVKYYFLKPTITDTLIYKPNLNFHLTNKDITYLNRFSLLQTSVYDARYSIYGPNSLYLNSYSNDDMYKGMGFYYNNYNQHNTWGLLLRDIMMGIMKSNY